MSIDTPPPLIRYDVLLAARDRVELRTTVNGKPGAAMSCPRMGTALRLALWLSGGRRMAYVSGRRVSRKALTGQMLYHTCREARRPNAEPCEYVYLDKGRVTFASGPPCAQGTHARPRVALPVEPTPYIPTEGRKPAVFTASPSAPRSRHAYPKLA